jgi:Putative Flp pilus-assembly TadE/G-like
MHKRRLRIDKDGEAMIAVPLKRVLSMRRHSFLRRFIADRRANTALLFSLSLPIIVGVAGLGVETGFWYFKHRELQTAADVAAIAGAVEKRGGAESGAITAAALAEAVEHGFVQADGTIDVNDPPESGSYMDEQSVEVLLSMPAPRFFSQIYTSEPVTLSVRGVANFDNGGQACILALDPEASGALTFTGNALTLINGCNVMSNSLDDTSLIVNGSADVTVPCALAAGGVSVDDGLTLTDCPEAQENVPPAVDPFKNLPQPSVSGPCLALPSSNAAATLSPGRYCSGGSLKGNKTFLPGTYILDGVDFAANATANITGTGVTFFLTNNAKTAINGSAHLDLNAPTSGTYKGVLFYGDPDNSYNTNKFNGNATSSMTGALYFPSQDVEYLGNFSGDNGCLRVVAATIKFTGSVGMNADCTAAGLNQMPLPGRVSLVE